MRNVLMAHKNRGPYPNHLNGVGGKIEPLDLSIELAALREIFEETRLSSDDIKPLTYLVTQTFPSGAELNVFYTKIKDYAEFKQVEDEKLEWVPVSLLLDVTNDRLAGDGNIPYFINYSLILEELRG